MVKKGISLLLFFVLLWSCGHDTAAWERACNSFYSNIHDKDYEQAIESGKAAIEIGKDTFGYYSDSVASAFGRLGQLYRELEQHHLAREAYSHQYAILSKIAQSDDIRLADAANMQALGDIAMNVFTPDVEQKLLQAARIFGSKEFNPETGFRAVRVRTNLGAYYLNTGRPNRADTMVNIAIHLCEKIYGSFDIIRLEVYAARALVLIRLQRHEEAIKLLQRMIENWKRVENDDNITRKLSGLYNQASLAYFEKQQYEEARYYIDTSIHLLYSVHEEQSVEMGKNLLDLATINTKVGRYQTADSLFHRSSVLLFPHENKDSRMFAEYMISFARNNIARKRYEEARQDLINVREVVVKEIVPNTSNIWQRSVIMKIDSLLYSIKNEGSRKL